jgi:uncharacterized membrane protein
LPRDLRNTILILAIIIFAAFIRSINIGKFGLYGDEKYSIMVVNGISWEGATQKEIFSRDSNGNLLKKYFTPKEFWNALSFSDIDEAVIRTDNGNSSTYYALLYLWKSLFGQSDGALRSLGLVFDVLTILLVFLFCKNILNAPNTGLIASFLLTIEPFLIAYSHQMRNYPVGIFLTMLSVYLFFRILKNESQNAIQSKWYLGYGLVVLLAILCHFYVVLFIFCQFVYLALTHFKNRQILKRFIITYIGSFLFLGLWFTIGSGRYTFDTFKGKDEIFRNIVKNQTASDALGWVTSPTFDNIRNKMGPIFTDSFLITNDIFWKFNGKLNLIFCLILSCFLGVLLYLSRLYPAKKWIWLILTLGVMGLFYFIFSLNPLYYIYLSVIIVFAVILIQNMINKQGSICSQFQFFAIITILLPVIITIATAIKSGHTGNIYQKYLSFGLPVGAIFIAYGLIVLLKMKLPIAFLFVALIGVFVTSKYNVIALVLSDNYNKYNIVEKPRGANPYVNISKRLEKMYQPGDTIIYPNAGHTNFDKFDKEMEKDYVSVVDAQLTNIYLPKTAEYIQRVEPNEANKLYLYQSKTNQKVLIFDFEGNKYRY